MKNPVIEFHDFGFRYASQSEPTLHGINLTIFEGEKVLILGPSGSGKSTLANCINGLIPFSFKGESTGEVKVAGMDTRHAGIFSLSKHVGTVLQDSDAQFVALSVGEDIAFALENQAVKRSMMIPQVIAAASIVGMQDFLNHVPYALSGGQKQKVSLAGVLHEHVDIVLFDEPLASLDPKAGMHAVELIDDIHSQGKTVVIIEHRLEDVLHREVDRILVMDEGRIVFDGDADTLLCGKLLPEIGIREPLFITQMHHAGCVLHADDHPSSVTRFNLDPYRDSLLNFIQTEIQPKAHYPGEVLIEATNVRFSYDTQEAIKNISFQVRKGEKIAFIGKNGAGKSTMAKLLCGIVRPDHGSITYQKTDLKTWSIREIGEKIGFVMQNPNQMLVKNIIKEEVAFALTLRNLPQSEIDERVQRALTVCGLWPMRNWPVSAVSYGQRKRITVAAMLALDTEVLILDEPTAGQDYRHYTEIMDFLDDLNRQTGITIIFITHDMHLAIEYTDRAIVFADGEKIADDLVVEVLSDNEIIEKANLKQTSLYTLALRLGLPAQTLVDHFIGHEREVKIHE